MLSSITFYAIDWYFADDVFDPTKHAWRNMLFSAAARLGGAVPAVMFGGAMTLLVVGLTTAKARQLFVVSLPDNKH